MAGYNAPEPSEGGLRRQLLGTLAALVIAVILIALPQGTSEDLAAAIRNSVLRPFIGLNQLVVSTRIRAVEASQLRAIQDSLVARLTAQTTLAEENRRLRSLLDLSQRIGPEWRSAEALRPSAQGSESHFLMDVGTDDGVRERAPIITREGLAGVVRELRSGQSVGMDWTHPDFAASAMSEDGVTYGLVVSRRGDFREQDRLVFRDTPYNTVLDSGTVVLTSGLGGTFPRGIAIGRIEGVLDESSGWQRSYWLTPFVDPGSLTVVLVGRETEPGSAGGDVTDSSAARAEIVSEGQDSLEGLGAIWPRETWGRAGERGELVVTPAAELEQLRDSIAALEARIRQLGGGGGDSVQSLGPAGGA